MLCLLKKKAPLHDLRVKPGRCTDLAFPNAPETTRGEVVLSG